MNLRYVCLFELLRHGFPFVTNRLNTDLSFVILIDNSNFGNFKMSVKMDFSVIFSNQTSVLKYKLQTDHNSRRIYIYSFPLQLKLSKYFPDAVVVYSPHRDYFRQRPNSGDSY
jgi:hypothetical protein